MAQDIAHTCAPRATEEPATTNPMNWAHWGDPADPTGQQQGRMSKAAGPSPARLHRGLWQTSPCAMEATSDRRAGTQSRRGLPAKQRSPTARATGVRRSYRRLTGAIPPVVRDTPQHWAAPRAAAQRRGHVALVMDTCGDTLPRGTPGPGGHDTAFPSTCGNGLRGILPRAVGGTGPPLVRPSYFIVKGVILSSRRYLISYLSRCVVLSVRGPWPLGFCSLVCMLGVLCVRCPPPVDSRSLVCPLGVLCCMCSVLGHLAPVHRCAFSTCLLFTGTHPRCAVCAVSLATCLLFTGVPARCNMLCVRCPWPLGSWSSVCTLGLLCCICSVFNQLAPVHRCARFVCCVRVVLSHLAPVHRCACSACCVAFALSMGSLLQFTGPLGNLCYVCGFFGHLAPVRRCARSVCCV